MKTLGLRALNRALLARQLLLARGRRPVARVIEHLIGLQAQNPADPYVGLWSRVQGFRHEDLSRLLLSRRAVRLALMRSTIHLVTARDCRALRVTLAPMLERDLWVGNLYGRNLKGIDVAALTQAGRALLDERPRTTAEAGALLAARFPGRDAIALGYGLRNLLALVQVPPRGVWGRSGAPVCATAESWLGKPLGAGTSPTTLVRRYLAAFGPASVADMQAWSGLTRLAEVFKRMRRRLRVFRGEDGRELFDLPRAPRPDADRPAPVRFLPVFDNAVLGHADRSRIVPRAGGRPVVPGNVNVGTVLVDGFVGGLWRVHQAKRAAVLRIALFDRPTSRTQAAVQDEAEPLVGFVAGDAPARDVRFVRRL